MTQVEIEAMIRKYAIILDGDKLAVRIRPRTQAEIDVLRAARDEIAKYLTDVAAAEKAAYEARQARIRLNVPGLDEVREAIEASRRQHAAFERAMDRGDGRLPAATKIDLDTVKATFPRAAAYIKAESYSMASWDVKADAGRKAMERLEAGEDHIAVLADMDKALTGGYID